MTSFARTCCVETHPIVAGVVPLIVQEVDFRATRKNRKDGFAPVGVRDEIVADFLCATLNFRRQLVAADVQVVSDDVVALQNVIVIITC